ncbi:MAG: hypothetical protein ABIJ12_10540 [bacterium]
MPVRNGQNKHLTRPLRQRRSSQKSDPLAIVLSKLAGSFNQSKDVDTDGVSPYKLIQDEKVSG